VVRLLFADKQHQKAAKNEPSIILSSGILLLFDRCSSTETHLAQATVLCAFYCADDYQLSSDNEMGCL
jgi:hypothetical protein